MAQLFEQKNVFGDVFGPILNLFTLNRAAAMEVVLMSMFELDFRISKQEAVQSVLEACSHTFRKITYVPTFIQYGNCGTPCIYRSSPY
jgi:hypothetical protein